MPGMQSCLYQLNAINMNMRYIHWGRGFLNFREAINGLFH